MLVFKMGEILVFTTMWINLETIMLSELKQPQEDKHHDYKHCMMMLIREVSNSAYWKLTTGLEGCSVCVRL